MKVAVACDHAGFGLKDVVLQTIQDAGHEPLDLGTFGPQSVDYPDFAEKAGYAIHTGQVERAVLLCGSGVGICIAANKIEGVYAATCHDAYSAAQGVEHDHMNALCLGSRIIGSELARVLVLAFLSATPSTDERHLRRINKVLTLEQKEHKNEQN